MAKKNNIIRFEQNVCNADANDNSVLFVKVNDQVTDKNAYVEIPQSHTALIVKGGSDVRYYERGPVKLFDDKSEIKDWKKGFSVEVVYIAKNGKLTISWGTPNKVMFLDEASNRVVKVGANGEFDIAIQNPLQFYLTTAVCAGEFDRKSFTNMYRNIVVNLFADVFLRVLKEKHLTYYQCDANKLAIGESIGEKLNEKFVVENGLSVNNFIIREFMWSPEDLEAIDAFSAEMLRQDKLKEYLAEVERLDDKQWKREQYLRQLELQDKEAYYEVLKVIGSREKFEEKEELKCPNCGTSYKSTNRFCPHCGRHVGKEPIICPHCGHSNESTAAFCVDCGKKLIGD